MNETRDCPSFPGPLHLRSLLSGLAGRLERSSNPGASFAALLSSRGSYVSFLARVGVSESEFGNEKLSDSRIETPSSSGLNSSPDI